MALLFRSLGSPGRRPEPRISTLATAPSVPLARATRTVPNRKSVVPSLMATFRFTAAVSVVVAVMLLTTASSVVAVYSVTYDVVSVLVRRLPTRLISWVKFKLVLLAIYLSSVAVFVL